MEDPKQISPIDPVRSRVAFFVKRKDSVSLSLAEKLCREMRPGAIIFLTDAEFELVNDPERFKRIDW